METTPIQTTSLSSALRDGPASDVWESSPTGTDTGATTSVFGRVATPPGLEATSDEFAFWVPEGTPVEKTQIVRASASYREIGGKGDDLFEVIFYAVVEEVSRRSRRQNVIEERDRYDGVPEAELVFDSTGVTYARARMLASNPPLMSPPREETQVMLASEQDARAAYGFDDMNEPMPFGLLKNGASRDAGPAYLDLAYLLGQNGAHANANGMSGVAAKSSTLMTLLACLLHHAATRPNRQTDPLHIVPVVLNVKGTDLLFLDHMGKPFQRHADREQPLWKRLGIAQPGPFQDALFFAPQQAGTTVAVPLGRTVEPYSWGLRDLVEHDLFLYLFGDDDREDNNFLGLVTAVAQLLGSERLDGGQNRIVRRMRDDAPARTLDELLTWIQTQLDLDPGQRTIRNQPPGTWSKLYRRLLRIAQSGSGVIRRYDESGRPLDVTAVTSVPPRVVDIQSIADPGLQRFVVAALLRQVVDARTGPGAIPGLRYVLVLDELNRWAPRGSRDPITRLVESVAAEMRSQGVVLFGAQQQASQVSEKVIENASIKLLGRTGAVELEQPIWRGISPAFRRMIGGLRESEKVVLTPTARQPMLVRMPFPAWAMRRDEAVPAVSERDPGVIEEE